MNIEGREMVTRFLSRLLSFSAIELICITEGRPLASRRALSSSTSLICSLLSPIKKQYSTTTAINKQNSTVNMMLDGSKRKKMEDLEQVFAYHQETKHQLERYAKGPGMMDWSNQPNPFREYTGSQVISLDLTNIHEPYPTMKDLFTGSIQSKQVNFASISQLFRDSLSLSSWKSFRGNKWALRCNPSSGNLHPTEGFLIAGPIEGLSSKGGVYHYQPKDHALEKRTEFPEQEIWSITPNESFFIGLSSIHWRGAWKYGERAFRYCQHDVGHAIEAINIAAGALGWQVHLLDDIVTSQDLFHLFGLEQQQQQGGSKQTAHEEPDCLLLVTPANSFISRDGFEFKRTQLEPLIEASKTSFRWSGTPNKLSRAIVEWKRIDEVCEATRKWTSSSSQLLRNSPIGSQKNLLKSDVNPPARKIIHQRRSAVDFDPDHEHPMPFSAFLNILRAVQHPFQVSPWNPQVHLAMFVHSVEGLSPGLYFLVRDLGKLQELKREVASGYEWIKPTICPEDIHLYQLALDDSREIAKAISCHQDIAGDSSFSLGMIARFEDSIQENGPWFYRRLFWETGMIGQRLYLQAEAVGGGFRGTGIGCFFDDVMHSVLGIQNYKDQSLYHFTVGFPIVDERLMTLDPYHHLSTTTKQA